jgi:hypothetical protein
MISCLTIGSGIMLLLDDRLVDFGFTLRSAQTLSVVGQSFQFVVLVDERTLNFGLHS